MAASFFTEEHLPGAVSGAAGGYERGQERKGEKEVARFPGIAVGSASEVELQPILARYTLSYRT